MSLWQPILVAFAGEMKKGVEKGENFSYEGKEKSDKMLWSFSVHSCSRFAPREIISRVSLVVKKLGKVFKIRSGKAQTTTEESVQCPT